jgi:hypothetical protein
VLASGHDPEVYAGGILKVCKFCIRSPLACASGASGADLKRRVRQIMTAPAAMDLSPAKRMLLAGAATFALLPPVLAGFLDTPLAITVQHNVSLVQASAEEAVSAVVDQIGMAPVARVTVRKLPPLKRKIAAALPPPSPVEEAPVSASPPPPIADEPAPAPVPPVAEATASVAPASAKQALLALYPTGDGDPDAVTCRVPQQLPGSRLAGPQVCKTNRVWAALRANREDISPDGKMIVYLDDFQRRKAGLQNCRDTLFARAGVTSLAGPSTTYCF